MFKSRPPQIPARLAPAIDIAVTIFRRLTHLPGLPWSPEFMGAYEAAMAGGKIEPGKSRIKRGSVADLITIY